MSVDPGSAARCHVLREDPELAEAIPAPRRLRALAECIAHEVYVPPGSPHGNGGVSPPGGIGLLVLEGLMIRRVGIDGRFGAELLGEGDLLRPWGEDAYTVMLPLERRWTVVEPARLAILDDRFVQRISSFPELAPALVARALRRTKNLAINMAIVHQARVDVRLQMLLWHLAGRWGRVRSDSTVLPLRLTHTLLADLVAARRPTVTTALSDLTRRGVVESCGERWLLFGEPPRELFGADELGSRQTTAS